MVVDDEDVEVVVVVVDCVDADVILVDVLLLLFIILLPRELLTVRFNIFGDDDNWPILLAMVDV